MATLDAAAAFDWDDDRGSLTAGKQADIVALPLSHSGAQSADETLSAALLNAIRPAGVWLGGKEWPLTR
jgi:cytosine/adenosine deaminase-related metal-dependent hydrolase